MFAHDNLSFEFPLIPPKDQLMDTHYSVISCATEIECSFSYLFLAWKPHFQQGDTSVNCHSTFIIFNKAIINSLKKALLEGPGQICGWCSNYFRKYLTNRLITFSLIHQKTNFPDAPVPYLPWEQKAIWMLPAPSSLRSGEYLQT